MEKIFLATNYYLDDKLAGCNAATERMFTRLLAYCGAHDTGGKLPQNPHKFVGLVSGFKSVSDLVSRGVLIELSDGGYRFAAWSGWQEFGDDLAERRRKDRERKRAKREAVRGHSADVSAEFRTEGKGREGKGKKDTPTAAVLRNVDRDAAAAETTFSDGTPIPEAPDADEHPPTRGSLALVPQPRRDVTSTAATAVRMHIPATIPATVRDALAAEVTRLARDPGVERADIDTALDVWATRPAAGPKLLPHLVADAARARQARAAPTVTKATQRAQATLAAGEALIAKLHQQEQP